MKRLLFTLLAALILPTAVNSNQKVSYEISDIEFGSKKDNPGTISLFDE